MKSGLGELMSGVSLEAQHKLTTCLSIQQNVRLPEGMTTFKARIVQCMLTY